MEKVIVVGVVPNTRKSRRADSRHHANGDKTLQMFSCHIYLYYRDPNDRAGWSDATHHARFLLQPSPSVSHQQTLRVRGSCYKTHVAS